MFYPVAYIRFQDLERYGAFAQHFVVECADIKGFAQCFFRIRSEFLDFEFTDLQLTVKDIAGKPVAGAECRLWAERWNALFKKKADANGVAAFIRIPWTNPGTFSVT